MEKRDRRPDRAGENRVPGHRGLVAGIAGGPGPRPTHRAHANLVGGRPSVAGGLDCRTRTTDGGVAARPASRAWPTRPTSPTERARPAPFAHGGHRSGPRWTSSACAAASPRPRRPIRHVLRSSYAHYPCTGRVYCSGATVRNCARSTPPWPGRIASCSSTRRTSPRTFYHSSQRWPTAIPRPRNSSAGDGHGRNLSRSRPRATRERPRGSTSTRTTRLTLLCASASTP